MYFRELSTGDIPALQQWVCTYPAKRHYHTASHPAEWELKVQSFVRETQPQKIARDPYKVSIGAFSEGQIAAAALITYRPYDDVFDITYISTAAHAQNQGIAQQLIRQCVITAQEHPKFKDLTSDIMTCAIDRRNTKSQRAFERFGFTLVDDSHPQLLEYALRFMRGLPE